MMSLCCDVLNALQGKSLVTAESCTGGWIGKALTSIPGSSNVYKGGIICYTNFVKEEILGVKRETLNQFGAVSAQTAGELAQGVCKLLNADVGVSVTGLAGPGGDDHGNDVGTVYIGCKTENGLVVNEYHFAGDRDLVRSQAVEEALKLILNCIKKEPTV